MAGSLNKVMLIGNLGADPEAKHIHDKLMVNLRLATSESWRDKSGERVEKTEWHTVTIFNEAIAKVVQDYCKKGSKIYVEGKLQTRKWQDKEGNDRWSTEVVLQQYDSKLVLLGDSGGKSDRDSDHVSPSAVSRNMDAQAPLDDEVPF